MLGVWLLLYCYTDFFRFSSLTTQAIKCATTMQTTHQFSSIITVLAYIATHIVLRLCFSESDYKDCD